MDNGERATRTVVLVADDDATIRELLAAVLADESGLYAVMAHDGAEALAAVEKVRPQVVLLDIHMPGLTGLEVAQRLRANPAMDGVAIVGFSAAVNREAALAAGCDEFISKPFDLDELVNVLRRLAG
jgi:CheY-like chemotaxis protein